MGKVVQLGEYSGEIVEEKYNPLIRRKEVVLRVAHIGKSTPSRWLLRSEVAKLYGVSIEQTYVKHIYTEYGMGVSKVKVHIYDSAERAKQFEPEYVIKRNEEQPKQAEQAAPQQG